MDYVYLNARIRAKEEELLTNSDYDKLINAPSYESALSMLLEKGYKTVDGHLDIDGRRKSLAEPLFEALPDFILHIFRLDKDFYNIKLAIKAEYTGRDIKELLSNGGNIDKDILYESITNRAYEDVPNYIKQTAENAFMMLEKYENIQLMEIVTDNALQHCKIKLAKETGDIKLCEYLSLCTDIKNIKTVLRIIYSKSDISLLKYAISEGGRLSADLIIRSASFSAEVFIEYIKSNGFILENSDRDLEKQCDDIIMHYLKSMRYDVFSILPSVLYMEAIDTECKNVQIILLGKKNGAKTGEIRERIRDTYV